MLGHIFLGNVRPVVCARFSHFSLHSKFCHTPINKILFHLFSFRNQLLEQQIEELDVSRCCYFDSWMNFCQNFISSYIYEQLRHERIKSMALILEHTDSAYFPCFKTMFKVLVAPEYFIVTASWNGIIFVRNSMLRCDVGRESKVGRGWGKGRERSGKEEGK